MKKINREKIKAGLTGIRTPDCQLLALRQSTRVHSPIVNKPENGHLILFNDDFFHAYLNGLK